MKIKNIQNQNNNFQKLRINKKVIMPIVFASALITGAASVDKFEKQETLQNKSITNTKSPVEGLLTASVFGLMGLYDDKKSRSLVHAINNSRLEEVKVLLQFSDVDPNFQIENGNAALGVAVTNKNVEAVKELLKHPKINPNITDRWGNTPLYMAVRGENIETLKELLNHPETNPNIKNNDDNSPLIRAIDDNNMEIIKELLQHPNIDVNIQDKEGDTPLYTAVRREKLELVKELLNHPDINPNVKNNDDNSPLIKAIENNSTEIIKELLQHPNIDPNVQDKDGDTPLYIAVRKEKLELVKELLKRSDVNPNIKNNDDNSPLIKAIENNSTEIIKELLQHPNIDPNVQDKDGDTPLYIAVRKEKLELVKELLSFPNINPNIPNEDNGTPSLIKAINNDNIEIFKALLQHPNIDPNVQDKDGDTALVIATRKDKQEFVKELLKHEALNKRNKLATHLPKMVDETLAEIRNILMSSKVQTSHGASLNSINFVPKTIDYLLENTATEEKQEIIKLLKSLNNLSYHKADENGISAIEKIFNAEDFDLLELLKGKDLEYKRDFDYAFDRIENEEFKKEVLNLKFTFKNLEDAVNIESLNAIDKCKVQFTSPLFSARKNGAELWNSVCKHWDNKSFVLGFIDKYYKYCSE